MSERKRRPRGTGTIEPTREGRFRARFRFGASREDIEGSPFPTYEDAEAALDAVLAALRDGGATRGGITLRKLGERALAQRERDGYRAIDTDRHLWDGRVEPWDLASEPAASVTAGDVRAWLSAMRREDGKPLATQSKRNALNLIRSVFAYGVEHELIAANPCVGIKIRDHGRTTEGSTHLSAAEVDALLEAATDPAVALAIGTGMRSGELRTLHWADVSEDAITVRYGGIRGKTLLPPKSGRIRQIPILPLARRALDRLRAQGDETLAGIVLPSGTRYYRPRGQVFDRLTWLTWLKAAKIVRRVRPHDLRHTCATLLLTGAWGRAWSYEEVKEMLGHSSVKVTERYAHATGTRAQKAAEAMLATAEIGPQNGPRTIDSDMIKAREILERRGSDSNRRMTVLQTEPPQRKSRYGVALAGLARAILEAAASGSPYTIARAIDLAEAVLDAQADDAVEERSA